MQKHYFDGLYAQSPELYTQAYEKQSRDLIPRLNCRLGISYGDHPRQCFDLFFADGTRSCRTLVFIHGGYWCRGDKKHRAFIAPAWIRRGIHVIIVNYRLAPDATLNLICQDMKLFFQHIHKHARNYSIDTDRIVVSGNSAGAHLVAMTCSKFNEIRGACLLSGLYDLRPLVGSEIGNTIGLNAENAMALSPLFSPLNKNPAAVFVGDNETDAFKAQTRIMIDMRTCHGYETIHATLRGHNHFSIIREVGNPEGQIGKAIMRMLS
ncbi:MAG: alpha/beta hydrolase [Hyphomonadaceae bacterium]|nr:alpha/beta hydrolase [Hyphomonadaceae bacterium]